MRSMMWYEWKKIWGSRLTQMSVLGCTLFLLFCAWSNIRTISATDSQGHQIYGLSAKKILKQNEARKKLDQNTVEEIMQEYLDGAKQILEEAGEPMGTETISDAVSDKIIRTLYLPKGNLYALISATYREAGSNDKTITIYRENMGRDFYQARSGKNREYTEYLEKSGKITAQEAAWWNIRNDSVKEYSYGYRKGWEVLLDSLPWGILVMMIVCVGTAPVFAGEYQSKCDSLLLCMKYGRTRLAAAKTAAAWLYASVVYIGIMAVNSAVILLFLGTEGWDLPVQLYYPTVPVSFQVNMGQACALMFLLGYVFTLSIMSITLWMSSILKNAYGVIVAAFLLLIVPAFLQTGSGGYLLEHILSLMPSKIIDFSYIDYTAYSLGGKVLDCLTVDLVVNGAAAVVFSAAGYAAFGRHQVNK